ncbi:competence protein ComEA [Clostridium sp. SM-530-WT-3G]|nr:competence protein ComEA [Clostridium sp. SM-530-WT-3G]
MEEFFKDRKKIGIFVLLLIVIISSGIIYCTSGYKELKKNDNESIFIEEETSAEKNYSNENYENRISSDYIKSNNFNKEEKNITVEIKGEVKNPDVYVLEENSIVKDLIEKAGGLTENADINSINRAKQLQNHELIYIYNKNEESSINVSENTAQSSINTQVNSKVNINSATIEELKTLKGIGESKANSIIEYREKSGAFKSIEDIKNVDGIGEKVFEKIKDSLTV